MNDEEIASDEVNARRAALAEQPTLAVLGWFIGLLVGCVMMPIAIARIVEAGAEAFTGDKFATAATVLGLVIGIVLASLIFVVLNWLRTTPRWRWSYGLVAALVGIDFGLIFAARWLTAG